MSWLWLNHWRAFTDLSQRHSCVLFAVFIWVTVVFEGETLLKAVVLNRFSSPPRMYCDLLIFFSNLTSLPVPAALKISPANMLPPSCFNKEMELVRWWAMLGFLTIDRPNSSNLVSSNNMCFFLFVCFLNSALCQTPSEQSWAPYWGGTFILIVRTQRW